MAIKIDKILDGTFSVEEKEELYIIQDIVKWAYVYFGWTAYDYQVPILKNIKNDSQAVFRLGRRLGKTEIMCILILWYAFTQYNKKEVTNETENVYDILIICPYESQVKLVFKRIKQLIDSSPAYQDTIARDVKFNITLTNGSNILGMTAASRSGTGSANTRGQRSDLIVLDEVDYMLEEDITNIRNIKNEDPERIRIIAASTPSGKRESYYKWCTYATKHFHADIKYIEETHNIRYILKKAKGYRPNGWTEYYAPSTVNKRLLKINPDTNQTYIDDLRDEFPEYRFQQEVMGEFGEELSGVYQKKFIDYALELGRKLGVTYANGEKRKKKGIRFAGVDYDKFGAESSIIVFEWDKSLNLFIVLDKVSIPRTEYTLSRAVSEIVKLNELHDIDHIYCDRGYGEMQLEQLHLYGKKHPESGLHKKVKGISFGGKIRVRDPYTKKKDDKDVKPFMVNSSVNLFEKGMIALNPADNQIKEQLEGYVVKSVSPTGRPIYTDENEHYVDAINLAILALIENYDDMVRTQIAKRVVSFKPIEDTATESAKDTYASNPNPEIIRKDILEESRPKGSVLISNFGLPGKGKRSGRTHCRSRATF